MSSNAFWYIVIAISLGIGIIFIIRKMFKKKAENEQYYKRQEEIRLKEEYDKKIRAKEKNRKQEELPIIINEANSIIDKYEKHISNGQDKYQIGRSLYEIKNKYNEKFKSYMYLDTPEIDRQKVAKFDQRILAICDTDILIERGFKDYEKEQKQQEQQLSIMREKKQKEVIQTKKEELITKTFQAMSKELVEIKVNQFISKQVNYVLIFKAPIERIYKSSPQMYTTTITMKKIK